MATFRAPRVSFLAAVESRSGLRFDRLAPTLAAHANDPRVQASAAHTAQALQLEQAGRYAEASSQWTAAAANLQALGPSRFRAFSDMADAMKLAAAQDVAAGGAQANLEPEGLSPVAVGAISVVAGLTLAAGAIWVATR